METDAKGVPTKDGLEKLSDGDLLDHLDAVSAEVKRRNGLRPATAGQAAVDVMKAIGELARGA